MKVPVCSGPVGRALFLVYRQPSCLCVHMVGRAHPTIKATKTDVPVLSHHNQLSEAPEASRGVRISPYQQTSYQKLSSVLTCLPGGSVRSHRLKAQFPRLAPFLLVPTVSPRLFYLCWSLTDCTSGVPQPSPWFS